VASALQPPPEAVEAARRILADGGSVEDMLAVVTPMIAASVAQEFLEAAAAHLHGGEAPDLDGSGGR
jgi:hypothetical protein